MPKTAYKLRDPNTGLYLSRRPPHYEFHKVGLSWAGRGAATAKWSDYNFRRANAPPAEIDRLWPELELVEFIVPDPIENSVRRTPPDITQRVAFCRNKTVFWSEEKFVITLSNDGFRWEYLVKIVQWTNDSQELTFPKLKSYRKTQGFGNRYGRRRYDFFWIIAVSNVADATMLKLMLSDNILAIWNAEGEQIFERSHD